MKDLTIITITLPNMNTKSSKSNFIIFNIATKVSSSKGYNVICPDKVPEKMKSKGNFYEVFYFSIR